MSRTAGRALTPCDAAEVLDLTGAQIWGLLHTGQLPAFRVGHSWRIPVDAVGRCLRAGPPPTPGDAAR